MSEAHIRLSFLDSWVPFKDEDVLGRHPEGSESPQATGCLAWQPLISTARFWHINCAPAPSGGQ